jgi:crotonobetainyl-CoA:carnitine CoA-transferase CaiB-like acyl-CoA transferase
MVAAPFCAQVLGRLGALVTKLTRWEDDPLAQLDDGYASVGRCLDDYCNGDKTRAVAPIVDASALVSVCKRADVLVCDWTPQEQAKLGLSLGDLRELHPNLIIVSITGYGLTGPRSNWPASELTAYHSGGEGYTLPGPAQFALFPDRPPVRAGRFLADFDTGLTAAAGTLAALLRRGSTGQGEIVEVAGQEVELSLNRTTISRSLYEGRDYDRTYRGFDYAGFLRCLDGWACVRPSEQHHWRRFVEVIGQPKLADDPRFATRIARFENSDELNSTLERWTRTVPREVVRQAVSDAGCPGGSYLEPIELLDDEAINSRDLFAEAAGGGRAPARMFRACANGRAEPTASRLAGRLRAAASPGAGPLAGLRVLDFTWVAAGPYATELMGFFGAEVIRVESRSKPDIFRRNGDEPDDDLNSSIRFVDLNQGKRSICVDLKHPQGLDLVMRLAEDADVLIENFRPGVRERLGFGDDALHDRNPAMVVVSLSGFGRTASDRDRPGYASIFSAESGVSTLTGYAGSPPTDIRDTNDLRAGTMACVATLAGLLTVLAHHRGVSADVAARDALICLQGDAVLQASRGGAPSRSGNEIATCVPYDVYRTASGDWVAISVRTDEEWRALTAVADTDLRAKPAWVERDARLRDRSLVNAVVADWVATRETTALVEQLCRAGVPAGKSVTGSDLGMDRHLLERGFLGPGRHARLGEITYLGSPVRFGPEPVSSPPLPPPLLGEHLHSILQDKLGLSRAMIAELRASGAVQ